MLANGAIPSGPSGSLLLPMAGILLSNSNFGPGACNVGDEETSIVLHISGPTRLHIEARAQRAAGSARVGVIVEVNERECARASHYEKYIVSVACVTDVDGGPHTIALIDDSASSSRPRYSLCVAAMPK